MSVPLRPSRQHDSDYMAPASSTMHGHLQCPGHFGVAFVLASIICTLLSSCTSPGAFRNVPRSQPHALLIAQEYGKEGMWSDWETLVRSINGQPVAHASVCNFFRIPPGATVIQPELEDRPKPYAPLPFNAVAGHKYLLCPYAKAMGMHLVEEAPDGQRKIIALWTERGWQEGFLGRPLNTTPRSDQSPSTTR